MLNLKASFKKVVNTAFVVGGTAALVATGTGCRERAYDGIDGPDYCVWSDWNNPHCGECKEAICEGGICEDVPCEVANCLREFGRDASGCYSDEGRDRLYSEREKDREEEEKMLYATYCDHMMVEALAKFGKECDPYEYMMSADERYVFLKRAGMYPDEEEELKSTDPKDICLENYLGAVYKKGKCIFPVKQEPMYGRAGVEKKFPSCEINEIKAGKNNTATVQAVCMGVPSIINIKRYYQQKGRSGR